MDDERKGAFRLKYLETRLEEGPHQGSQDDRGPIAPWWHCGLLVAIIVAASAFGSMHSAKTSVASHHLANYGVTLAWEWALAGLALWGIRLGKTPLRQILGERRRGLHEFFTDVAAAGIFWICS